MHHVLWLGIGDQHVVLTPIPHISKSRPMKHETTLQHEIRDFLPRGRFAEENRLTRHDAGISSRAVKAMNVPIEQLSQRHIDQLILTEPLKHADL